MHLKHYFIPVHLIFIISSIFFESCSNKPKKIPVYEYLAEVEYYNPNTGTDHTYELSVVVKEDRVIAIEWPNGGQLDDSHFKPAKLDDNGVVTFTSDKGYKYTITITDDDYFEPEYPDYEPEY